MMQPAHVHNLEWDPREEHQCSFAHAWVVHPMAAAAFAFLKTLAVEPKIKPGTPDPYRPPKPGEFRQEERFDIGVISQYATSLTKTTKKKLQPEHGINIQTG